MRSKLRVIPYVILLLPLDAIVAVGILLAQLCRKIFPSSARRGGCAERSEVQTGWSARPEHFAELTTPAHQPAAVAPPLHCEEGNVAATIVIVNLYGKHLLADCLPAVIEAVKCAGGTH